MSQIYAPASWSARGTTLNNNGTDPNWLHQANMAAVNQLAALSRDADAGATLPIAGKESTVTNPSDTEPNPGSGDVAAEGDFTASPADLSSPSATSPQYHRGMPIPPNMVADPNPAPVNPGSMVSQGRGKPILQLDPQPPVPYNFNTANGWQQIAHLLAGGNNGNAPTPSRGRPIANNPVGATPNGTAQYTRGMPINPQLAQTIQTAATPLASPDLYQNGSKNQVVTLGLP